MTKHSKEPIQLQEKYQNIIILWYLETVHKLAEELSRAAAVHDHWFWLSSNV
jgi:hypothetical protein